MQLQLEPTERDAILRALITSQIADEDTCRDALEHCHLIPRLPALREIRGLRSLVAYVALRTRASGITLGDRIFFRRDCFGEDGRPSLQLLAHELAHVVQFRRDGTSRFLATYLLEYARNLGRGLAERDAYLAIPYEEEARAVEAVLRAQTSENW